MSDVLSTSHPRITELGASKSREGIFILEVHGKYVTMCFQKSFFPLLYGQVEAGLGSLGIAFLAQNNSGTNTEAMEKY